MFIVMYILPITNNVWTWWILLFSLHYFTNIWCEPWLHLLITCLLLLAMSARVLLIIICKYYVNSSVPLWNKHKWTGYCTTYGLPWPLNSGYTVSLLYHGTEIISTISREIKGLTKLQQPLTSWIDISEGKHRSGWLSIPLRPIKLASMFKT